ncbi:hypothetical protein ACTQ4Q_07085 [Bacillota bacterium LCP21S3_D9]
MTAHEECSSDSSYNFIIVLMPAFYDFLVSSTTVSTRVEASELLSFYLIGLWKHVQCLIGLRELINSYRLCSASTNRKFMGADPITKLEFISISIWLFSSIGMISAGRMHLYLALLFHRDYFTPVRCISIWLFVPQGLFRPAECIFIWLFCTAGIISPARMHPITGRPSLKTSLPGHSVKFRFN